jgi:hypothetical protein
LFRFRMFYIPTMRFSDLQSIQPSGRPNCRRYKWCRLSGLYAIFDRCSLCFERGVRRIEVFPLTRIGSHTGNEIYRHINGQA